MSKDNTHTLGVPMNAQAAHYLHELVENAPRGPVEELDNDSLIHVDNFRNQLRAHLQRLARGE